LRGGLGLVTLIATGQLLAQLPVKPVGFVTDAAAVLSPTEIKLLSDQCAQLDRNREAQVAIVTIVSLQNEPIGQAALRLFRQWGIGRKDVNDGVLVMLAIRDRQSRITVGYGLEQVISDKAAAIVLDSMKPDLRAGRYARALDRALNSLGQLLTQPREY
jgi:uncharacterized protein